MHCPRCSKPIDQGASFCGNCGQALLVPGAQQAAPAAYTLPTAAAHDGEAKAILSLAFGIIGILTAIIPFIGIIFGIAGIVLGTMSRAAHKRKLSIVGIILSVLAVVASIGILAFVSTHSDELFSAESKSPSPAANATNTASTPCYSVGFTTKLSTETTSGSCNMSAYNGSDIDRSSNAYKIYATNSTSLNAGNFQDFAKKAIEKDVAANLPGFTVTSSEAKDFAGSPAYMEYATNEKAGVTIVEAAIFHESTGGDNVFVIAHAVKANSVDLKDLEAQWQWK